MAHSLSPTLHNAAFAALGMDAHYEARDVSPEDLVQAVAAVRQDDCLGANVTAPHKQAALALMDDLSEEVVALGALNTIVNQSGRLLRHDHSGAAFLERSCQSCLARNVDRCPRHGGKIPCLS